ncbi:Uroporphyrinogen-III methylase-like protein [Shewanella sediminis HAW-EB3]|uniref:uroporphyrinogen-III C-methyltransferase n=1 Tax=Shewanella sediminis (strain HAW-EB3) TaxID=425104 RepID=A8FV24_SHESH|nr:uroporphyrinogen-III C-methyltransferase [Shewanella sediminis]ABV36697.1 Uroporphyrinogen-III methylase-like protein [Shewanella sediminis HAW-EB3]
MNPGKVFLVGAGPGDPGLLTWRAIKLMSSCDVVCYDLLVSPAILSLVPAEKEMMPVGYRGYCGSSIEYGMHPDVVAEALAGKTVLRLKSGDPFIFGRATEECRSLSHHGIDYEIVPGITSALGAAAYAGFPLTSNGMASDVTFVSGHRPSKTLTSWASMGKSSGTLVLYMGAKKLALHAAKLIAEGRDPDTPVALVSSATSYKQKLLTTTLGKVDEVMDADIHSDGSPVLVIMGQVVELSSELDWRSKLLLAGRSVMVPSQHEEMAETLRVIGAEVIRGPGVEMECGFNPFDWNRIMASTTLWLADEDAAKALMATAGEHKMDIRLWPWQISGKRSAQCYLARYGIFIDENEEAPGSSLSLVSSEQDAGLCGCQLNVTAPKFSMGQLDICWVDDSAVMEMILARPDLFNWRYLVTTRPELAQVLRQQGIAHHLVAFDDIGQQLSMLTVEQNRHVA